MCKLLFITDLSYMIPGLLLLGAVFILFIYHLSLYLQYKERIIWKYSFYLFSISIYLGSEIYNNSVPGIENRLFSFWLAQSSNFIAILGYASFLMEIVVVWKKDFPILFFTWRIIAALAAVIIGFFLVAAFIRMPASYLTASFIPLALRTLFIVIGVWALIVLYPRLNGRFINMIKLGGLVYLLFMIMVMIAGFFGKNEELFGLGAMHWFYLGTFTDVIIFSIAMGYKIKELFTQVAEVRNRLSRDLHDEIGATLTGVTMMSEFVKKKLEKQPEKEIVNYVERITAESKLMSEKLNDIVWATNPDNDSTEKIIFKIQSFAAGVCAARDINFHVSSPSSKPEGSFNITTRNNLYNISKEAINNAVKYSGAKNIYFKLEKRHGHLVVTISDDGGGFDPDKVTPGNGLKNIRTRAEEMNASFNINSAPGKGTSIELRLT